MSEVGPFALNKTCSTPRVITQLLHPLLRWAGRPCVCEPLSRPPCCLLTSKLFLKGPDWTYPTGPREARAPHHRALNEQSLIKAHLKQTDPPPAVMWRHMDQAVSYDSWP